MAPEAARTVTVFRPSRVKSRVKLVLSESSQVGDTVSPLRVTEDAILFPSRPSPRHRRFPAALLNRPVGQRRADSRFEAAKAASPPSGRHNVKNASSAPIRKKRASRFPPVPRKFVLRGSYVTSVPPAASVFGNAAGRLFLLLHVFLFCGKPPPERPPPRRRGARRRWAGPVAGFSFSVGFVGFCASSSAVSCASVRRHPPPPLPPPTLRSRPPFPPPRRSPLCRPRSPAPVRPAALRGNRPRFYSFPAPLSRPPSLSPAPRRPPPDRD